MSDNITFEDCFVAFLDVLGIKKLLDKIAKDEELAKNMIDALKINTKFGNIKETSLHGNLSIRSFYFSDSFAFIMKKEKHNLPHLFLIIRFLQDRFWEKGFCFRRAITIGKMYWPKKSENIIFGKGMRKAHDLESKIAIYPRIIISDDLFKFIEVKEIDGYPFTKNSIKLKDVIIKDKDGVYFLDLLNSSILRPKGEKIVENNRKFSITWNDENESKYKEILESVEKIIDNNLNNQENQEEKIKQKYEWLKSYLEEKKRINKYD